MSDEGLPGSEILLYRTEDGRSRIECRFEDGTIWLTQAQMAALFETSPQNITQHLRQIFAEAELSEGATCKDFLQVRSEGGREVRRSLRHYSLPAILAVGFRVRSPRGTEFRQWANDRLDEYLRKGFVLDDERLKNPPGPGVPDHFDELLERIRDIRASERRMYLRVRDILALAADYTPKDEDTQVFFQTVLLIARANVEQRAVRQTDVLVSENHLQAVEIEELNRIVVMFLDFAEHQARRRKQVFMRDWREKLDDFLRFDDRKVLPNAGSVERSRAEAHAAAEYDAFSARRRAQREAEGAAELEKVASRLERLPRPRPESKRSRKKKDEE